MRLAVVVAPSDPRAGDAVSRREALAWLRGRLAQSGFDVAIVSGGTDPEGALDKAASRIAPGDAVVVHLSGRLADGGSSLAFGAGRSVPLAAIARALEARSPAEVGFVAELLHAEDPDDAQAGAACVEAAVRALRSPDSGAGRSVLAAIRPLSARVARLAFTERTLAVLEESARAPSPDAFVAGMHERAAADADIQAVASWLTFVPAGASDPAPAAALEPLDDGPPASERERGKEEAPGPFVAEGAPGAVVATDAWTDAPSLVPPPFHSSASNRVEFASPGPDTADFDARIAEATDARDWRLVLDLRLSRLGVLADPGLHVRELIAIARLLQGELGDPDGAIAALEQARAIEPERASVLRALRRGYEALGRWASAIEVIGVLSEMAAAPLERAALRVAQAVLAVERLGDEKHAEEWLQAALHDDPSHADALARLARLRAGPAEAEVGLGPCRWFH